MVGGQKHLPRVCVGSRSWKNGQIAQAVLDRAKPLQRQVAVCEWRLREAGIAAEIRQTDMADIYAPECSVATCTSRGPERANLSFLNFDGLTLPWLDKSAAQLDPKAESFGAEQKALSLSPCMRCWSAWLFSGVRPGTRHRCTKLTASVKICFDTASCRKCRI